MAWVALLFLVPIITFSASNEVCIDDWKQTEETWYANGHLYSVNSPQSKILVKKNIKGEVVGEFELPRIPENIDRFTPVKNGFIYRSSNISYYFNEKTKKEVRLDGNFSSSPHDDFLHHASPNNDTIIFDPESTNFFKLPPNSNVMAKGKQLFAISGDYSEGTIVDTTTKSEQKIKDLDATSAWIVSDSLIGLDEYTEEGEESHGSYLVKQDGKWKVVKNRPDEMIMGGLQSGELLVTKIRRKDGKKVEEADTQNYDPTLFEYVTEVREPNGKVIKTLPGGYYSYDSVIKKVTANPRDEAEFFGSDYFLKSIKNNNIPKPQGKLKGEYSIDDSGRWMIYEEGSSFYLMDLKNNKKHPFPSVSDYLEIKQKGDKVLINDVTASKSFVFDTKNETLKKLSNVITAYGFDESYTDYLKVGTYRGFDRRVTKCFGDEIKIVEDDCNCLIKSDQLGLMEFDEQKLIDQMTLVSACKSNSYTFDWNKYAPPITKGEISKKQALIYLYRFQKIGEYSPDLLPILVSILKSDLVEKNTYEVMEALKRIPRETVKKLYIALNLEKRLPKSISKSAFICRDENNPYENGKEDAKTISKVIAGLAVNNQNGTEPYLDYLPYRYDLQSLPAEQKNLLIDQVAENISQNASQDRSLAGVFPSKLYYFSKKFAMNLFGEEFKPATDLSVSMSKGAPSILIMSSSPINGQDEKYDDVKYVAPKYGFHYKSQPSVYIPEDAKPGTKFVQKVEWQNETDKYSANLTMNVQDSAKEIVPRDPSPDYQAMKKDGAKTGLMIIGSNLAGNASLGDEYLTYYQNEGFTFEAPKDIDALKFFENEVKSGRADYFIKEAHSDGDEKNLFRINNKGTLLTGTRLAQDGTKEVIHIVVPTGGHYDTTLISNHHFGEWIKARTSHQPFYYFNSSCNSDSKVINEISAVSSPNFVPIATTTTAYTFSTKKSNAMNAMLTAFRNEKDYSGIRENMKTLSPRYASGRSDQFIFPDEEKYEEEILDNLSLNLDTRVEIKDSKGKEIHIDEHLDHE